MGLWDRLSLWFFAFWSLLRSWRIKRLQKKIEELEDQLIELELDREDEEESLFPSEDFSDNVRECWRAAPCRTCKDVINACKEV